jgi:hypothetical protein
MAKARSRVLAGSLRPATVLAVAPVGISSWIAAGFLPFTWPMRITVVAPVLAAAVFAARPSPPGTDPVVADRRLHRWCVAAWITLLALATAWELLALFSSPRDDHPTLSSMSDSVMSTHPGRALTFALWLLVGWLLFVRPRSEPQS